MKEILLMYARYTERANASVVALLDKLPLEELNADRKSYYKSLVGLLSHAVGGAGHFLGLFSSASPAAAKALASLKGLPCPRGDTVSKAEWEQLKAFSAAGSRAMVDFVQSAKEAELSSKVKIDWYGGNPDSVPVAFLLNASFVHGIHHRGQISQILDSMGVEHDFSGLDLEFFPR